MSENLFLSSNAYSSCKNAEEYSVRRVRARWPVRVMLVPVLKKNYDFEICDGYNKTSASNLVFLGAGGVVDLKPLKLNG